MTPAEALPVVRSLLATVRVKRAALAVNAVSVCGSYVQADLGTLGATPVAVIDNLRDAGLPVVLLGFVVRDCKAYPYVWIDARRLAS